MKRKASIIVSIENKVRHKIMDDIVDNSHMNIAMYAVKVIHRKIFLHINVALRNLM